MIERKWGQGAKGIGVYTYLTDGVSLRQKQMLAGFRKWELDLLYGSDWMSLSERATKGTGIPAAKEVEK